MKGIRHGIYLGFLDVRHGSSWGVNCARNRTCVQRKDGWVFGYWNWFGAKSKAAFARELKIDGWTYRGSNRWYCPKCSKAAP